jgi:hypothetical protein
MATPPLLAYGHPNSISQPCLYDFLTKISKTEKKRNTCTEILVRVSPSLYILPLYYIYTGYFLEVHYGPEGGSAFFRGKGYIFALVPLVATSHIPDFKACSGGLQRNRPPNLDTHPVPKVKKRPPWWYRSRPALRGGVAQPGVPVATPGLYPAHFSPPGSPATFGCAEFTGWHTGHTLLIRLCLRCEAAVTFWTPARPHSDARAVTLRCTHYHEVRVPLRLADVQLPHPSAPTAVHRTDRGPTELGWRYRAGCHCASDQLWW